MGKIEFGVALPAVTGIAEFARRAEELGFDFLACGEHVMFHGPVTNTFIALSVAAGVTRRIKLLSSVVLLPLYPAALAAKMGAVLDVASGGRYHFGVGIGGEFPKEFEACGVPVTQRGARTNEALEVITRLWTEKNVAFEGRFTKLSGVTIDPPPVQKPRPPIWVAGRKEPAMRRAARYADGWIPYMYTPQQLRDSVETIARFRQEYGKDMSTFTPGLFIFSAVHANGDEARQMAAERLGRQYAQDFSTLVNKYALAGTPEECRKRLQEYVDAGARMVILPSACRPEYLDENMRLLVQEVLPAFRQ
ncbi:MAG: LLM class flavin-dependent oxidoreductase [Thermodesulfobacteriota bacterium]|jgi:probable F420-dependent oxidoreductase